MPRSAALSPAAIGIRRDRAREPGAVQWTAWFTRMLSAVESRRRLASMDDRMLADIGITRVEALREAARPPWDLVAVERPRS